MSVWPDLFGPGWAWGVLFSFGVLGGIIVLLMTLESCEAAQERADDLLLAIERRYEQGDLTSFEFERLKRAYLQIDPSARFAGKFARTDRIDHGVGSALWSERRVNDPEGE